VATDPPYSESLPVRYSPSRRVQGGRCGALTDVFPLCAGAAATRLLKNQDDIGNAIVPVYGKAAGAKLTGLLREHIMIAVDLIAAAKAGNQAKFAEYDTKWTKNAEDIAGFLSGANPHWPKRDVVDLLNLHLNLTKKEVVARLTRKWEEDVQAFDDIFTEIMTVSDTLAEGIHKQFPGKFP
jgi:hypothetical protein